MKNTLLSGIFIFAFCFQSIAKKNLIFANIPSAFFSKAGQIKEKMHSADLSTTSPFGFAENKGQILGYDGLPHTEVKFAFQQGSTQIFLLEKGIAYQFTRVHYPKGFEELMAKHAGVQDFEKMHALQNQIRLETFRMDMSLVGASANPEISTEGRSEDYTHFYNRKVLDVHRYSKIIYHSIYPGIDWVISIKNKEVKYDFVLRPDADPSLIKMMFKYQEELSLNEDGSFTLKSSLGSITEKRPVSFQGENLIGTRFLLKGDTISFSLDHFDAKQNLVIDPSLIWATYCGGTGYEEGRDCTTDASGNVYLTGRTDSNTGIASGGHQNFFGGSFDAFLVKYNSSGVRQWGTYYGGTSYEDGVSCVTDTSGNVYIAGRTASNVGIAFGGHLNTLPSVFSAFLVKFNSNGIRQWGTYYGGNTNTEGFSCATDPSGNIYLAGHTQSTAGIASAGHQNNFGGGSDAFLVKFNSSGVRQWGTYYGGTGIDYGNYCATDTVGNVYLTGFTNSTVNIASGGHQNTFGGGNYDSFLVKFNGSGMLQWGTYYGGTSDDYGTSCDKDNFGNIYLTGLTAGTGGSLSFLVKFDVGGMRQWENRYVGSTYACVVDALGFIYVTGTGNPQLSSDALLMKFDSSGVRQWATYYGGSSNESASSCALDASGNVYLGGRTESTVGIASGGHQNTFGGYYDAYLVKFCNQPNQPSAINGNTNVCIGSNQSYSVGLDLSATSYNWSLPVTWSGSSGTNTIGLISGTSGTLSVAASNTCGASLARILFILSNPIPSISVNSGTICTGQSFTILPNGASTYTYSSGSNIVIPTSNTAYSVMGTSSAGCVSAIAAIANVAVSNNPPPLATLSLNPSGTYTFCPVNSITLTATNNMSFYLWSNGATTQSISVNDGGNYSVQITDSNGCSATSFATTLINMLPQDFNKDGIANVDDFLLFVPKYNSICNCPEDLDEDGDVDVSDFQLFAAAFGTLCQ